MQMIPTDTILSPTVYASISHFHDWSPGISSPCFDHSFDGFSSSGECPCRQASSYQGFCTCHSFCQESSAWQILLCSLFSSLIQFSLCSDCPLEESYWLPIPNPSPTHKLLCYLGLINLLYGTPHHLKFSGYIRTSLQSDLDMVLPWWCQW